MRSNQLAPMVLAALLAGRAHAAQGPVPAGVPPLDHVLVIMMENHGYSQIIGNPNAPFINAWAKQSNLAANYFAIAHPSLTNHLEIVGGSNFGVLTDSDPAWHDTRCATNLSTGRVATETPPSPPICPIAGTGTEAATPAIDYMNESQGPPGTVNIDGVQSIPAATDILGMTIADQLVATGRGWKSYEEGLPAEGAERVNFSDGLYSNLTDFSRLTPPQNPPLGPKDVVALYAPKHNPFVYFRNVQEGTDPRNSLRNSVSFEGIHGLYADLRAGQMPALAFIAPSQCNDQHGRANAGPLCSYDPKDDGSQEGLNPALIHRGDLTLRNLIGAIKASPAWSRGRNAIVVVWDENDYSRAPNTNQVVLIVDTNYGARGVHSSVRYTHFSLLKSLQSGFRVPCLNHACDADVAVMADLFAAAATK
jgi:hypothetical protein